MSLFFKNHRKKSGSGIGNHLEDTLDITNLPTFIRFVDIKLKKEKEYEIYSK
jgi:hypothetical protein